MGCQQYKIFDSLPYIVAVFNLKYEFVYANRYFLRWIGYIEKDLAGRSLDDLQFYPCKPTTIVKKSLNNGKSPFSWFGFYPTPKHGPIPMEVKWSYRFDSHDHLSGFTCIAFDLEVINDGRAVGYNSKKGTAFTATKKFLDILGYTVDTTALSQSAKQNSSIFYVNPSDKDRLLRTPGEWLILRLRRMNGEIITVKTRTTEYENVHRTELQLIE